MPVPTSMSGLSVTDAGNSPAGSETVGTNLDNYIRSTAMILRRESAKGVDVASASTINVGDDGNYFVVTGTVTITGIATEWVGRKIYLRFAAALQLTHNATSFILPGAANITTAAGDVAVFIEETAGNWRCISYQRSATRYRLIDVQTFTASGTWTRPAGAIAADVEVQDGGGGGAGSDAAANEIVISLGGSGGGYRRKFITSGLGATETVTVGAGGAGGAAANGVGGDGGASGFGSHLAVAAGVGGEGGTASASGVTSRPVVGKVAPAAPTGGDINIGGGPGSMGYGESGTIGMSCGGGDSMYGKGAQGVRENITANDAIGFGSGGGAPCSSGPALAGRAGGGGLVIVRSYGL